LSSKNGLITFVRNAELGKVKTRIAASAGDEKALAIYKALLTHTRSVTQQVDTNRHLFYTNLISHDDEWPITDYTKHLQIDGDLGSKMKAAFEMCLVDNEKAVIIGSDCASLQPHHIENAYQLLDDHDLVIGPTYDGGYYLLGMKKLHYYLFDDMQWSVESVYDATISRAQNAGLSIANTEQLSDIDYIEDWEKWGWPLE